MQKLAKLYKDFCGLIRICGPLFALRWMFYVTSSFFAILKSGNLQLPDSAMGDGPFKVTLKQYKCHFKINGPRGVSGIRDRLHDRRVVKLLGLIHVPPTRIAGRMVVEKMLVIVADRADDIPFHDLHVIDIV